MTPFSVYEERRKVAEHEYNVARSSELPRRGHQREP